MSLSFATVGASLSENVIGVRCAPKQSERRYPRQVNRSGKRGQYAPGQQLWHCGGKHAPQSTCMLKFERRFRWGNTWHIAKSMFCNCKSRVRSVMEESPHEHDDQFMVLHDALKSGALECLSGLMAPRFICS